MTPITGGRYVGGVMTPPYECSYYTPPQSTVRWDAIDFEEKTITIRHTVNETRIDGKYTLVLADTTKTKSSYRKVEWNIVFHRVRQIKT